jgi:predicted RND superfamily exporter protein
MKRDLFYIGIIIVLLLIGLYGWDLYQDVKNQNVINSQNLAASRDSTRTYVNKWGEEVTVKNILIADKEDLKKINKNLFEDVKRLEGKVKYISNIVTEIKNSEPIVITNTIRELPDGTKELAWNYKKDFDSTNSRILEGNSKFSIDTTKGKLEIIDRGTTISRDEMKMKITTGLTESDSTYQIYVKTDYPGVKFTKIEGFLNKCRKNLRRRIPHQGFCKKYIIFL